MTSARLLAVRSPSDPQGVVLVLHGGAHRGEQAMVSPTQLSVLRMVPIARRIARAGGSRLAVHRLLNSRRGWDSHTTPVMDVAWALDRIAEQHGDVPVALVGHSLGGRAALLGGEGPQVRTVVALNPWVLPTDRTDLGGRRVLVVHGSEDRIALPSRSADLARRAGAAYVSVPGAKHAMLRHGRAFETYAADFVTSTLLGDEPRTGVVASALGGARTLEG